MILREHPLGVGKARLTLSSVECFVWDLGFWCFEGFGFEGFSGCMGLWVFPVVFVWVFLLLVFVRSFMCIKPDPDSLGSWY
jgi:uncharacterized membrane protein